ncbi:MAG: TlpA family protein disulfide reductase [Flavobacteriaceae bacterium]
MKAKQQHTPMRFRFSLVVVFCLCILACKETVQKPVSITTKIAEQEKYKANTSLYQDLEGNPIALDDYKGKRVLLNYWATWCRPCIEEMPSLLNLQEALKEDYVVLLASDQSVSIIQKFKDKKGFDFNFIKFNGAYANLGINALPVTIVYNTMGEEVERIAGATTWDSPEMVTKLKSIK